MAKYKMVIPMKRLVESMLTPHMISNTVVV